ncbi:MAG: hypothetical protein GY713_11695 [Actinomycetia bacterium]|nr:hypothetical protein [Actinomycetes bacterium]
MTVLQDRLELLRTQTALTGIDFLSVSDDQLSVDVYFHVDPDTMANSLENDLDATMLSITATEAVVLNDIPIDSIAWPIVNGRKVLRVAVDHPGEFVIYRFVIDHARVDRFFADVPLNFKAACPRLVDCERDDPICPEPGGDQPPLDYAARDIWAMRRAMLDLATLRNPDWTDRNEADVAIMMIEALASIGDEIAYSQDRFRWESNLFDATQRRSQRRHAQLVDHIVHDGLGASTWLMVTAAGSGAATIPAGTAVSARTEDGRTIPYAIGTGLDHALDGGTVAVDARRNRLTPHIPDNEDACLPRGSTEIWVVGTIPLPMVLPKLGDPEVRVALHVDPPDRSEPILTHYVRVVEAENDDDPLFADPVTGNPPVEITRLRWRAEDATPFDIDLTSTVVFGNIVPATAGTAIAQGDPPTASFVIGRDTASSERPAVERLGPNGATTYLFGLDDDPDDVVRRPANEELIGVHADPRATHPEIRLAERVGVGGHRVWEWRSALVGFSASRSAEAHYTLDDGTYGTAVEHRRATSTVSHDDYVRGTGHTIRFGDDVFGITPTEGRVFDVWFRRGNGAAGNVAPGAIRHVDKAGTPIDAVTNLTEVTNGRPAESIVDVRRTAPHEWREITYRAVRTEDYAEAVSRLDWVQAAGAVSRWTGSWMSIVTTPDPVDASILEPARRAEASAQVDRFRQAGRDAWVARPRYADLDLVIEICVDGAHFQGDVLERVLLALVGDPRRPDEPYFFHPARFVFGTPLDRGHLEAAIQAVAGVKFVEQIEIRRHGHFDWRPFDELRYHPGDAELVRVVNDPLHPDRGIVRLTTRGGS